MERRRRRFTREFKLAAVKELRTTGATLASVSQRLGVSIGNLSQWRTQLDAESRAERQNSQSGSSATNVKDVAALLKEIAQLKEERDTLRKALTYLAKDL